MDYSLLLKKYDRPVPRYTSYPTVPFWKTDEFDREVWRVNLKHAFDFSNNEKGVSLYIHLPFCESLCTYCACNTRITKNHAVEERYIKALLNEWNIYKKIFGGRPLIRELHLGGGTPTFFIAHNLDVLLTGILKDCDVHPDQEFSFEGHPNNTEESHLKVLYNHGFRRVSYGVQDLDEKVQNAIHRIQPFEKVKYAVEVSRKIGYRSVNFDLIYGLPFQSRSSVEQTIEQVLSLRPERISFYSYAHVPWIKPGQRGYEDADLPTDVRKRELYETGLNLLIENGYLEIGMDHFGLPADALAVAQKSGTLHRNFMGYTTTHTEMLIGLGTSAISETAYGYAQNIKAVEAYEEQVNAGKLPIIKGHLQQVDDRLRKEVIQKFICQGFVPRTLLNPLITHEVLVNLQEMQQEGLVDFSDKGLTMTKLGRAFTRNICQVFDAYGEMSGQNIFSKAI